MVQWSGEFNDSSLGIFVTFSEASHVVFPRLCCVMLVLERACGVYTTCLDRNATDCAACGSALTNTLSSRFSLGHTLRLSLRWTDLSPSQSGCSSCRSKTISTHESLPPALIRTAGIGHVDLSARDTLVDQVDAMRSSGPTAMRVLEKSVKQNETETNGDGLQPTSNGLQPTSDGLQPKSDGLQPTSDGLGTKRSKSLGAK